MTSINQIRIQKLLRLGALLRSYAFCSPTRRSPTWASCSIPIRNTEKPLPPGSSFQS